MNKTLAVLKEKHRKASVMLHFNGAAKEALLKINNFSETKMPISVLS